jgi:peptidoglycan/LPS O-acetylase OafA/YrhL
MVLVTIAFQLIYYPMFEWARATEEGIWSILWVSNVFSHMRLGDYFGETAGTSLLLHSWSLSVEFQAYIVLAIMFFWALAKNKNVKYLQVGLSILIGASLAVALASQLDSTHSIWQAVSSYYSPVTRFYQIGAGALLATFTASPTNGRQRHLLLGGLIVVGVGLVPEGLMSWNLSGLAAVIGATIFITFAKAQIQQGLMGKVLAKVGDYSYSIYLWHWPILVVVQSVFPGDLRQVLIGVAFTISVSLLSHRFLELPFMGLKSRVQGGRPKVISVFGTAMAFLLALILAVNVWADITPANFDKAKGVLQGDVTQAGFAKSFKEILQPCSGANSSFSANAGVVFDCYETSGSNQIDILVIGNSHAAHLVPGLISVMPQVKLRYLSFSGGFESKNTELREALDYWTASGSEAETLIINSFWQIERTDAQEIRNAIFQSKILPSNTYIFDDVPNFKISPVRCKYSKLFPIPAPCSEILSSFAKHVDDFHHLIKEGIPTVNLVTSSEFFSVDSELFSMSQGSSILFRDQNHLNFLGSQALIRWLANSQRLLSFR